MSQSVCLLLAVWIVTGGGGVSIEALKDPLLSSQLFYPFGPDEGDSTVPPNDDGSSEVVTLTTNFPFFNTMNRHLYVNTNGAISFVAAISTFTPSAFPLAFRMIAPYWCDIDTTKNLGRVFYRESTDNALLNRATQDVLLIYSTKGLYFFKAKWIFIATWYNVTFYGGSMDTPVNTFQAVLVTDGRYSFAIFNYGPINWTTGTASGGDKQTGLGGTPAQVGFNAGDSGNFYAVEDSRTTNIVHINETTNTGQKGRWLFRIEKANIEVGDCFKPGSDGCGHYQKYKDGVCTDIAPDFGCPSLEGPTVISRIWLEFYCVVPTTSKDSRSRFNVTFLFDGMPEPGIPQFVVMAVNSYANATLHEKYLKGYLGKWISCSVSSFWATDNETSSVYSQIVSSTNSYWAGIQPSTNEIYVNEGIYSDPGRLLLKSTLPITCTSFNMVTGAPSKCLLQLSILTTENIVIRLNGTADCSYTLTEQDWKANEKKAYNPNNPIEIYAKTDPYTTPPRPNNFTVKVKLSGGWKFTPDGDEYEDPWTGYVVETIWVFHVDASVATCRASGDPNLVTFDKVYYPTYASGQFTYIQTTRGIPVEIQVRHKPCGQTVSCVCGVAVREGNSILAADMCTNGKLHYITYNDILPDGACIKVSANGAVFEILTPGGIKVIGYLRSWGMNIEIQVTASEYGRVEGLCGSFDGNTTNDLQIKDTNNYLPLPPTSTSLVDFVKSWSVPLGRSLFDGYLSSLPTTPNDVLDFNETCSCYENGPSCGITVAKNPDNKPNPWTSCLPGNSDSYTILPSNPNSKDPSRQNLTDGFYDSRDFNTSYAPGALPNTEWPTTSNFTEGEAYTHCYDVLWKKLTLPKICVDKMKKSDIDGVINKCVSDIKMTDDLSWAYDKIDEIQSLCKNIIVTENTTSILDVIEFENQFADSVCVPHECSNHGTCINGTCVCDPGFIGIDCATPKDTVPQILEILYPVCDIRRENCESVRIVTTGVAPGPELTCRIHVTRWDGSKKPCLYRGHVESRDVTICPLPKDHLQSSFIEMLANNTAKTFTDVPMGSPILYINISLSNDRTMFGNVKIMKVIDSKCIRCQGLNCSRKDEACIIKGYCFLDGEGNPYNPLCEKCNPTQNETDWLRDPNCTYCDTPPCTGEGAMGVYLAEPKRGLTSPLNLTEVLANLRLRYRVSTNQYFTRLNVPQNLYTEVCAGMLPNTSAQLRLASSDAYPYVTFDWLSALHNGVDSGSRGAVMVANIRTFISMSQRLGGVYSSRDQKETSWSMFSVTDTMIYDSQLLCVYGSESTSVPGPLPMRRLTVAPMKDEQVLYNENTTTYSCRENTDAYFFSISVGVPAGKTATVQLVLSGLSGVEHTFEITRLNSDTNGTTTLARSIIVPCALEAQLNLVDGEVDYHGKIISFTAFPYAARDGLSFSWAGYRTSNLEVTGTVIYDRWMVLQNIRSEALNSVIMIPASGYYYVYLSAGVHPGQGLIMSLMRNSEVLFGLTRTATNHNGVDTIGHGMVVLLSAMDMLRVESNTTAYSTSQGLHTSFIGMLLYHE